jgi:glycosyltransferase involved in cell wall biosynthesis
MTKRSIGVLIYTNPDYYPATANAVELLSEHFNIILIGRNLEPPHWEYPTNVEVHRLGLYASGKEREQVSAKAKFLEYINFILQARYLLKDVSLIYAYDAFGYTAAYLCKLMLLRSVPLIYQNHETGDRLFPLSSLSGWVQRLERNWVHKADIVVFPDKDRAGFFQKITNLNKEPLIIPNFPLKSVFDFSEDWSSLIRSRWESLTLFYRGTISDTSAMKEIISAASLVNNSCIKFVGFLDDHSSKDLDEWVNTVKVEHRFSYLGKLPYEALQSHTLSATVGFALYKSIDLNRTACVTACQKIYEYAACGVPTIVSDLPNYRDYLSGESWVRFADPNNPHSIASAVQDILKDFDNYQEMCLAARRAFEEKFNYESAFYPLLLKIKDLVDCSE